MENDYKKLIAECLIDYSGPIYIIGTIGDITNKSVTKISATIPREKLIILNNNRPDWYNNVINNSFLDNNILIITDFEKISIEEQKLFLDIICRNSISSEILPRNLKIIINSESVCPLLSEINEVVQYIKV